MLLARGAAAEILHDRDGRLEAGDDRLGDNSYFDRYTFQVRAGDRVRIDMEAADFDAYLIVNLPDGTEQRNDDGAGGTNSRLEATMPRAGTLVVKANSVRAEAVGPYRLRVERLEGAATAAVPVAAAPATPPAAGESVGDLLLDRAGRLETSDLRLPADNSFYDEYAVPVRAGDRVSVRLESDDFDAYLIVQPPGGEETRNDDGGGGRNSLVEVDCPSGGSMLIKANSLSGGQTGAYRLRVERLGAGAAPARPADGPAPGGRAADDAEGWITGRLEAGDQALPDESLYDDHPFTGRRGEVVTVQLESDDFDPILWLKGPSEYSEYNDDADGRNSRIRATLPADGAYYVRVNSFGAGAAAGAYRLRIDRGAATGTTAPTAGQTIAVGRTVAGRLDAGDGTFTDGSYIDVYTFRGRAGQTVTARLESTDFDPILFLAGPGDFMESNDDGDGRNSVITATLPASGEYRLTANSYGAGVQTGGYDLSLVEGTVGGAAAPAEGAAGDRIRPGQTVPGALEATDPTLPAGEHRDVYVLRAEAGEALSVDLSSEAFDPYLFVRGPDNFAEDNDDFEGNRQRSRIEFTAPQAGEYRVIATSYRAAEVGPYRLSVGALGAARTVEAAAPTAEGRAIRRDAPVAGRLGPASGTLPSGEYRDVYVYDGRAGEDITIEMSSAEVDAYLFVRGPGLQMDNDDAEAGVRDARVDVRLPSAGQYRIYATTYASAQSGAYTLRIGGRSASPVEPVFVTPEGGSGGSRVYGVFAGITDYPPGTNDLDQCANDARKIAEVLRNARVSTEGEQRILLDGEATVANVRRAVAEIAPRVGPDDVFVFFFSGHGSQEEAPGATNERDGMNESIILHDGAISDDDFARMLDAVHGRVSIVALDACFSGGFRNDLTRPEQLGLFSSEEDLTSAVPEKFEAGGFLSQFLREGLLGRADADGNDRVTAGELCEFLHRQFAAEAQGIEAITIDGASSYQHLVVDRGGVKVTDLLLSLSNVPASAKFHVVPSAGVRGAGTPRRVR